MCAYVSCWFGFEEGLYLGLYAFKIFGLQIKKGCTYNLSNVLWEKIESIQKSYLNISEKLNTINIWNTDWFETLYQLPVCVHAIYLNVWCVPAISLCHLNVFWREESIIWQFWCHFSSRASSCLNIIKCDLFLSLSFYYYFSFAFYYLYFIFSFSFFFRVLRLFSWWYTHIPFFSFWASIILKFMETLWVDLQSRKRVGTNCANYWAV